MQGGFLTPTTTDSGGSASQTGSMVASGVSTRRQHDTKRGASPRFALHLETPVVTFHDAVADRQP
ncbi:MAG: hypothetical protein RL398_2531, partial [Planctomycetota bacterium]